MGHVLRGIGLVVLVFCQTGLAANISGKKWPGAEMELYVGMPGTASSGTAWSTALRRAAQEWNDKTPFTFSINSQFRDPCTGYTKSAQANAFPEGEGDGRNGAGFATSVCGNAFGTNVLAVTLVYSANNTLGAEDITETDLVFNENERYDIYDGPLQAQSRVTDFGRVALHELGHAMGMGHEAQAVSIMRPTIGNLFTLQADDIEGATRLYTGYSNCPLTTLDFGRRSGALASGDCDVKTMQGGGDDDSFVDTYQFELAQTTQVTFTMRSTTLDSVLVLMDARSVVMGTDDNSGSGCDARLTRTLAAGTYALLANTFSGGSSCGDTAGPYELTVSYASTALLGHGRVGSLLGGTTQALFSGGVTQTNGQSYSNLVSASKPMNVLGAITIDPAHRGLPGFLVVAGVLENGSILLRDSLGNFVPYNAGTDSLIRARTSLLAPREEITLLGNFTPASAGFVSGQVNFLIGYGLSSRPDELYFHSAPINVLIGP